MKRICVLTFLVMGVMGVMRWNVAHAAFPKFHLRPSPSWFVRALPLPREHELLKVDLGRFIKELQIGLHRILPKAKINPLKSSELTKSENLLFTDISKAFRGQKSLPENDDTLPADADDGLSIIQMSQFQHLKSGMLLQRDHLEKITISFKTMIALAQKNDGVVPVAIENHIFTSRGDVDPKDVLNQTQSWYWNSANGHELESPSVIWSKQGALADSLVSMAEKPNDYSNGNLEIEENVGDAVIKWKEGGDALVLMEAGTYNRLYRDLVAWGKTSKKPPTISSPTLLARDSVHCFDMARWLGANQFLAPNPSETIQLHKGMWTAVVILPEDHKIYVREFTTGILASEVP